LLNSLKQHPQKNKYDFDKDIGKIEEEVQKFIDRLVFICYCEDKQLMDVELNPIIHDKEEKHWDKEWHALGKTRKLFEDYLQKYNSDLFNESWCDKFYFDDNTLLKVLKDLRQPKGKQPYDFSIIEADILGAKAIGMHTIHFNAHNDPKHDLCEIINDLSEIKFLL